LNKEGRKQGTDFSRFHASLIETKGGGADAGLFERLALFQNNPILTVMKLALAVLVYVLIGVVLGAGILLTVAGKPWFLIAAVIAYVVAFGKIGCMTQ
jgi:hypothetical protein